MTKIYITDLEAYNNGYLVGEWIELPSSNIEADIERVLEEGVKTCKSSHKHEEYFITDYECDYMAIEEYSDVFQLQVTAERVEALTKDEQTAIKLMLENGVCSDLEEAIDHIEDLICTGETSMEDIAYQYIEDIGALKSIGTLQAYFDYEALGRDMEINGSYYTDSSNIIWEYVA